MKKNELKKIIGKEIGNWEIVNVSYEEITKKIELLLIEFYWVGVPFSRDYKEYTSNTKKIKILDEYAFKYYEDDNYVNAMQCYVELIKGLNLTILVNILNNIHSVSTTEVQTDWKNILIDIGSLNKQEYESAFLEEFKRNIIDCSKKNELSEEVKNVIQFIKEIDNKKDNQI